MSLARQTGLVRVGGCRGSCEGAAVAMNMFEGVPLDGVALFLAYVAVFCTPLSGVVSLFALRR